MVTLVAHLVGVLGRGLARSVLPVEIRLALRLRGAELVTKEVVTHTPSVGDWVPLFRTYSVYQW